MSKLDTLVGLRLSDAFADRFVPPTDPERKLQTLGRIYAATLANGEALGGTRIIHEYSPPWAIGSTAVAETLKGGRLLGVALEENEKVTGEYAVFEVIRPGGLGVGHQLRIADSTGLERVERLDHEPDELRGVVAAVALGFYERIHAKSQRRDR